MIAALSHIQMHEPSFWVRVHANTYSRDGTQISRERRGFNAWESKINGAALRVHALSTALCFAISRHDFNLCHMEVIGGTVEQLQRASIEPSEFPIVPISCVAQQFIELSSDRLIHVSARIVKPSGQSPSRIDIRKLHRQEVTKCRWGA